MSDWKIVYDEWNPAQQPLREALCTLGNGYFATRGAAEEVRVGGPHYPGTYLAGGYNRLKSKVAGRIIENEDLVNWPNWLPLNFSIDGGDWFHLDDVDIMEFKQELDLREGILHRYVHFTDNEDRETILACRRLVHMGDKHLAAIEWKIIPQNWSGKLRINSVIDGSVTNAGVDRYNALDGTHLEPLGSGETEDGCIYLNVQTKQSKIRMCLAARTRVYCEGKPLDVEWLSIKKRNHVAEDCQVECKEMETIRIEKIVSIHTSRDKAITEPCYETCKDLQYAGHFEELYKSHKDAWSVHWNRFDIKLNDANHAQVILRLHIFHLLQTASMNSIDLDMGIPARGWHGEAYRGHIFWDELFIFPFINFRIPELTRSLKMYRYRRLKEARRAAKKAGYKGAMFPWQSGSNGREESQVIHLNPQSGEWDPDNTYLQRHVNSAIARNVWQYYQVSRDIEFLSFYGAEIILEIARFWASIAVYNKKRDRYELHHVVGPDEFHTNYPDSQQPGLKNNAYTNITAAWVLNIASKVIGLLTTQRAQELIDLLGIDESEIEEWQKISKKMFVPFLDDHIISAFEGYENLKELDWEGYEKKYGNIQRLDRILKAEGDSPNRYKAGKQPDVLMLFYIFSAEELEEIFQNLGYDFDPEDIQKNIEYYKKRSSHGSSLSRLVYSWVLARSDREASWGFFMEALKSDIEDIQGGTTPEGIHLGAMAGTVDMIQRCYTGLEVRNDILWINPALPNELQCIQFRIRYRGNWIGLKVTSAEVTVTLEAGWLEQVKIGFAGNSYLLEPEEERIFKI